MSSYQAETQMIPVVLSETSCAYRVQIISCKVKAGGTLLEVPPVGYWPVPGI